MKIPFNKPYFTGQEIDFINDAVRRGHISGNGYYTNLCQKFFQEKYGFKKCLLTTSCTDALEMCAILADIKEGDEVIMPSFTFVSTAIAFIRQGARIVFADSHSEFPNMTPVGLESLITDKTKAIVVVHYAGLVHDIETIVDIAKRNNLLLIEDAAQSIDVKYGDKYAGTFGDLAAMSFHETKNISAGEGGLLIINDSKMTRRAQIIWEKGTNRIDFFNGKVDKYGWVDIGSSFLPSEIIAATLWAQLQSLDEIQKKRISIWYNYHDQLKAWAEKHEIKLMSLPEKTSNNAHMFYLLCATEEQRSTIISYLESQGIMAVFHYQSLHSSAYYKNKHGGRQLPHSDYFSNHLLRLPLYYDLEVEKVILRLIEY